MWASASPNEMPPLKENTASSLQRFFDRKSCRFSTVPFSMGGLRKRKRIAGSVTCVHCGFDTSATAFLQAEAWKIADQLGWPDTLDGEYLALTRLQADAFITLNDELARAAKGVVPTASIEALLKPGPFA